MVLSQQQRPQQRQQQQMNSGAICTFTRQWFGSRAGRSQINGFQASRSPTYVSQVEPAAAAGSPEQTRPRNLHSAVEYAA